MQEYLSILKVSFLSGRLIHAQVARMGPIQILCDIKSVAGIGIAELAPVHLSDPKLNEE